MRPRHARLQGITPAEDRTWGGYFVSHARRPQARSLLGAGEDELARARKPIIEVDATLSEGSSHGTTGCAPWLTLYVETTDAECCCCESWEPGRRRSGSPTEIQGQPRGSKRPTVLAVVQSVFRFRRRIKSLYSISHAAA